MVVYLLWWVEWKFFNYVFRDIEVFVFLMFLFVVVSFLLGFILVFGKLVWKFGFMIVIIFFLFF